mmetsp:Transcript_6055/g.17121  ORF Transcript_6055/g.17121 Transcript_6055/m.17121 type:complete len:298 (-) Transcript_6055:193-1086(-)
MSSFVDVLSPLGVRGGEELVLQPVWDSILDYGNPYVSHWLFAGWLTFLVYTLTCVYFTYKDIMRHDSKIQKDYWPTWMDMVRAGAPQMVIYGGLNGLFTYLVPEFVELPRTAPTVAQFLVETTLMFLVGDFLIYWEHRIMHIVPYLRKNIHNVHHAYHAPFSWAGGWVHPLEDAVVILCQLFYPIFVQTPHPLSFWCFVSFWTICLIEEHSGHDVVWAPYHWMPFAKMPLGGGGAPHDIHHYWPNKNFGFVLICWDQLFGTFSPVVHPPKKPRNFQRWWEWSRDDAANEAASQEAGF